ncbi:MAG: hypothetical protein GWN58_25315, partial [Anaerolineae bacterium]|nr:hypothetical protein [Anaerolineae bacterium]
ILGVIAAVAMLILGFTLSGQAGLLGLELGSSLAGIAMFVVLLIVAIFGFLVLYAFGESVYLFL